MSKSKYGNSNLYMTTREFADLVVEALEEQNYFKSGDVAHPYDIAIAFSTVGETIGLAMQWAIEQESDMRSKQAVMKAGDLKKSLIIPVDDEIAPYIPDSESAYSEWKKNKNA